MYTRKSFWWKFGEIVEMTIVEDRWSVVDDMMHVRKRVLVQTYAALPRYASPAFWQALAAPDFPLEILVRCARVAQSCDDSEGRNRILEIIVLRTQMCNEAWTRHVLARSDHEHHKELADDLYADLCERLIRALLDPQRGFWEENFIHCLMFERKHAFTAFIAREGYGKRTRNKGMHNIGVEQLEEARAMLRAIEASELLSLVLELPDNLKIVILLLFWEGWTEKDAARRLGVTDRTVRNRLRRALHQLRIVMGREDSCYV